MRGLERSICVVTAGALVCLALALSGCATPPAAPADAVPEVAGPAQPGIDVLIQEVARGVAGALEDRLPATLTVSFFTTGAAEPQVSPFSDYLAEGLTTELAAVDRAGLSVVSRRAVEQLLSEMEFQASELVDDQTQARLGRMAGADVILTGSVIEAAADTSHVLNAQLIDVETGVVVWGVRATFAGSAHAARPASTTVTVAEQERLSMEVGNLELTIVETFDDRRVRTSPATEEAFWGPRFVDATGSVAPVERDGGAALAYRYRAEFDEPFNYLTFTDTDGYVTLMLSLGRVPAGSTGVTFELNPGMAAVIRIGIRDDAGRSVPLSVTPSEWQRVTVPFGLLAADWPSEQPATLELTVPYGANVVRYAFPRDAVVSGELQVDNVGFYTRETPALIAEFESGEFDATFAIDLYESFAYVDYAATDAGTVEVTPGVSGVSLAVDHVAAVQGEGLRLSASAQLGPELAEYVDAGRAFVLSAYVVLEIPAGDQSALYFDVQSDELARGDLDLYVGETFSAYGEFAVSPFWGTATVALPPERSEPTVGVLDVRFPVSRQQMEAAAEAGVLQIAVTVDRFRAE